MLKKIVVINIFIFLCWMGFYFINLKIMEQNFLVSWDALIQGRWWTLVTSIFSHFHFFHLFINLYVLKEFGFFLEHLIGQKIFTVLYFSSGVSGSLCHCLISRFLFHRPELSALGASGAISGLLMFLAMKCPDRKVYFLGLVPVPILGAVILFLVFDLHGLWAQFNGGETLIGHGAHIGGTIAGLFYALISKKLTFLNG